MIIHLKKNNALNHAKMKYFDLDTEISIFSSQISIETANFTTVGDALCDILEGKYKDIIEEYRKTGDKTIKKSKIPSVAFHGRFYGNREKSNFNSPNGIIIVDIDEVKKDEISKIKENIILENDSCLAVFKSPSGNGIKCLYLVDPFLVTTENYRKIGRYISKRFKKYGKIDVLSVTDCLIMSYDSELLVNDDVIPDSYIVIDDYNKENIEKISDRDESIELFSDPMDFYETVLLEEIVNRADNNYHFIQMSVFELAKFGFKHPMYDLSFIIDFSESTFHQSSENKKRLEECYVKAETINQTRWPYNYTRERYGVGSLVDNRKYDKNEDLSHEDSEDNENIEGLINYNGFYNKVCSVIDQGDRIGEEISLKNFSDIFRFNYGLITVTGIPTHGKTELIDQIIVDLARLSGWKSVIAGFEQTEEEHIIKLMRKFLGFDITNKRSDQSEKENCYNYVTDMIKHVDVSKTGGDIRKILKVFSKCIEKYDTKIFVLDPFNMLTIVSKSVGNEKYNEILRELTFFAKQNRVCVLLVAHPTKIKKDEKTHKFKIPDLYDVKGTSGFYEMTYHGFVVYRDDDLDTPILVKILKVKQNNLGKRNAICYFRYHSSSGRFIPINNCGEELDSDRKEKNWHKK